MVLQNFRNVHETLSLLQRPPDKFEILSSLQVMPPWSELFIEQTDILENRFFNDQVSRSRNEHAFVQLDL